MHHHRHSLRTWRAIALWIALLLAVGMPASALATGSSSISGRVTDAFNVGLEGVGVAAILVDEGGNPGDLFFEALTDDNGDYTIGDLPEGSYIVGFHYTEDLYYQENNEFGVSSTDDATPIPLDGTDTNHVSGIDLVIVEGARIAGQVRDSSSELPLPDIAVWLHWFNVDEGVWDINSAGTTTDHNGKYSFISLDPGDYIVEFQDPTGEYLSQFHDSAEHFEDVEPLSLDENLDDIDVSLIKGGRISGQIKHSNGDLINEWIEIEIFHGQSNGDGSYSWQHYGWHGHENGNYQIQLLPPGVYALKFYAYDTPYWHQFYNARPDLLSADPITVTPGANIVGIDAQMSEGGILSGVVRDPEGNPLENIDVGLYRYEQNGEGIPEWGWAGWAATNTDGEYEFTHLQGGLYRLEYQDFFHGEYVPQFYNGQSSLETADDVPLGIAEVKTLNVVTMTTGSSIAGKVSDGHGAGIQNAGVTLYYQHEWGWEWAGSQETNSDGEYRFDNLRAGAYAAQVSYSSFDGSVMVERYYSQAVSSGVETIEEATHIDLGIDDHELAIDLVISGGGRIAGVVTDSSDSNLTLPGVEVILYYYPEGSDGWWWDMTYATTNDNGAYSFVLLPPGEYKVEFRDQGEEYLTQYYDGAAHFDDAEYISVDESTNRDNIHAQLIKGGRISGHVSYDGNGVEYINVTIYRQELDDWYDPPMPYWSQVNSTQTYTDGNYTVGSLPAGDYIVQFDDYHHDLYLSQYYNGALNQSDAVSFTVASGSEVQHIDALLSQGGEISGRVQSGGENLPDIQVVLLRRIVAPWDENQFYWDWHDWTYTQNDGSYAFQRLRPGDYIVRFYDHQGAYLSQYYDGADTEDGAHILSVAGDQQHTNIDAQLALGGRISGHVSHNTNGIEHINVTVYRQEVDTWYSPPMVYWSQVNSTQTDAHGNYTLGGLPADEYIVGFDDYYHGLYLSQYYNGALNQDDAIPFTVTPDSEIQNIDADLSLHGEISGHVSYDGNGVESINVAVYRKGLDMLFDPPLLYWSWTNGTQTDEDGNYSVGGLPPGEYIVQFEDYYYDLYLSQYYDGVMHQDDAAQLTIGPGNQVSSINAQLSRGGEISGRVQSGGQNLVDIEVTLYRRTPAWWDSNQFYWEWHNSTYTEEDGSYFFRQLQPGDYILRFFDSQDNFVDQYYDGVDFEGDATVLTIVGTQQHSNLDIQLARTGAISGFVTDADPNTAAALENIQVHFYRWMGDFWDWANSTTTDESGHYTQMLQPATYRLHFVDPSEQYFSKYYDNWGVFESATDVPLSAGEIKTGVNITLTGTSRITGVVTGSDSQPLEGMEVRLYPHVYNGWGYVAAHTDEFGEYTVGIANPGQYRIGFRDPAGLYAPQYFKEGGNVESLDEATPIEIGSLPQEFPGIDAVLLLGGEIHGTVYNESEATLSGIHLHVYRNNSLDEENPSFEWLRQTTTDQDGRYELIGLATGNYRLYINDPQGHYSYEYYPDANSLAGGEDIAVNVGDITDGIDIALELPVPPVATITPSTGHVSTDARTGQVVVSTPWGSNLGMTIGREVLCPADTTLVPGSVKLRVTPSGGEPGNYAEYEMTPVPDKPNHYQATISQAVQSNLTLSVTKVCVADNQDPEAVEPDVDDVGVIELFDPAGDITDADTGEPIVGARVELYSVPGWRPRLSKQDGGPNTCESHLSKHEDAPWSQPAPTDLGAWEPADSVRIDPRINPQFTNEAGRYAWDVAEGCWYVVVSADDYFTVTSPVVGVPPEVTDLNLALSTRLVTAGFMAAPLTGDLPLTVVFTNTSVGPATSYTWAFGDGAASNIASPTHVYTEPGIYTVKLTVTGNDNIDELERQSYIEVKDQEITGLDITSNSPKMLDQPVVLNAIIVTGSNVLYTWDFGDGTSGQGASAGHIYDAIGEYVVTLTATNSRGVVTATHEVTVHNIPIAGLTASNSGPVVAGAPVQLNAAVTAGSNVVYSWNFGDGATGSGHQVQHTYMQPGEYIAQVTASNGVNQLAATTTVIVNEAAVAGDEPITGLAIAPVGPQSVGAPVQFQATVSSGTNVQYLWDFGDENTGSGPAPVHTYQIPSEYAVTVTASNSTGAEVVGVVITVLAGEVDDEPGDEDVLGVSASHSGSGIVGRAISFTAHVTTNLSPASLSFAWDLGDGNTGSGPTPTHIYLTPGQYTASVTVSHGASSASATTVVHIQDAPIVGLTASNSGPVFIGEAVQFTAFIGGGTNVSYVWDFGDGATGSGAAASHSYATPGLYTAVVTSTNSANAMSASTTVTVNALPPDEEIEEEPHQATGEVTGVIYIDANGNGVQDDDEPGISDVEVTLEGTDGHTAAMADDGPHTTRTDANGVFRFSNVPVGHYVLTVVLPDAYAADGPLTILVTVGEETGDATAPINITVRQVLYRLMVPAVQR